MTLKINIMLVSVLVAIILVLAGITYTYTQSISRHTVENHQQALTKEAARWFRCGWITGSSLSRRWRYLENLYLDQGQDPRPLLKMTMAAGNFSDVYLGLF